MDLYTGEIIPLVSNTHKSSDFIDFLKILDEKYDKGAKIKIILNNHSAYTYKKPESFLSSFLVDLSLYSPQNMVFG